MIADPAPVPLQEMQAEGTVVLVMHYDYSQTAPLAIFRTLDAARAAFPGDHGVTYEEYHPDTGACVATWNWCPENDAWRRPAGWVRGER